MRYQSNRKKRQFLAGVKCVACGQLDTTVQIQVFEPKFDEYIECVACGHSERRPILGDESTAQSTSDPAIGVVKFHH